MVHQIRRLSAIALVLCMLLPLFTTVNAAEAESIADAPAAETPETAVPANETPAPSISQPIEADQQVSLSDEIRVIKGETKSLIPEAAANAAVATANPLAAVGVVWTSSDPTVATVSNTGVVTAHELGEATITATLNGEVVETYTVYSTLSDGFYCIDACSSLHMLCVDDISMADNAEMIALPQLDIGSEEPSLREDVGYRWYFEYQDNGYYSIHPAHSRELVLYLNSDADPALRMKSEIIPNSWQWKIVSGSYGYVFQNRTAPTVTFKFDASSSEASDSDIDYCYVVATTYSTTDRYQSWDIYSTVSPSGMLLYDTLTGELIGDTWGESGESSPMYGAVGFSASLAQLRLYVQILDYSNASQAFTMSFTEGVATYNMGNGTITGSLAGDTIATIARAIDGNFCEISFAMEFRPAKAVHSYYDTTFGTDEQKYIPEAVAFVNKALINSVYDTYSEPDEVAFSEVFNLFYFDSGSRISYSTIDSVYGQCTQSSCCTTTACGSTCANHHKNLDRMASILHNACGEDTSRIQVLWTDRPTNYFCCSELGSHTAKSYYACVTHYDSNGVDFPRPVVHMMHNPESTEKDTIAFYGVVLAHEMAHTLGLQDVYDNGYGDNANHDIIGWRCVMEEHETYGLSSFYNNIKYGYTAAYCSYCIEKLIIEIEEFS